MSHPSRLIGPVVNLSVRRHHLNNWNESFDSIQVWIINIAHLGRLGGTIQQPPEGWYDGGNTDRNSGNDSDLEMADDEWMGVVEWDTIPFSTGGDSGSLVFAAEGGMIIPLGIHVGAKSEQRRSYFILIETFCLVAEKEGWEMCFASA